MKSLVAVTVLVAGLIAGSNGYGGLVLLALVVAAVLGCGMKMGAPGHSHAGGRAAVARHEAGHVVAAKAARGGRVSRAQVYASGGGGVDWSHTPKSLVEEVEANLVFLRAGEYAGGSNTGCGTDRRKFNEQLRRLPSGQRSQVQARANARARKIVASRSGEINRFAAKLERDGAL